MTRSGGLSDISGSLPFGLGSHYQLHPRLASAVERPRLALPCPLQLAADVVQRHAAHDRPAVGAEVRRARLAEVADEALHLLARQRRVGLDRAAARNERERAPHRSSVGRQRLSSARAAGGRSTVSGNRSACEGGAPAASSVSSRSKSTRSCTTCWSRKKTSSSVVATMNVSCTWPSTRPKRPGA